MANLTVQRNKIADYLVVEGGYELMGAGFSTLDENPTAQVDTKTYVNDKSSSSVIKGYQTQFAFTSDLIASEKAVMALYNVGRNQLTGKDAEFEYIRVDLFQAVKGKDNTYEARKFYVTCETSSFAGAGGENVVVSGNLYANGQAILGEFNTKTRTFVDKENASIPKIDVETPKTDIEEPKIDVEIPKVDNDKESLVEGTNK